MRARVEHSFDQARDLASAWPALPVVSVPLLQALGRVLAEDLTSRTDVPAFPTSAMDGWAVAGPGPWSVLPERVLAGSRPGPLPQGRAVEIATGAMLPSGSDAVLRSEHGVVTDGRLVGEIGDVQEFLSQAGECSTGDLLLPAGTVITPPVLGLAATVGYDVLQVRPRPAVAVAVLGDELLMAGLPGEGRVRDSLSPQIAGWVAGLGGEVVSVVHVPDLLDDTIQAFEVDADIVLSTGGTAAGPVDHVHAALHALGAELVLDGVEVRPGHPMMLARLKDGRPFVGLPGNPLSACVCLLTLLTPVIDALRGRPLAPLPTVVMAEDARGRDPDSRLIPVVLTPSGAKSVPHIGSAMLRGFTTAEGVVVVPPKGAVAGDEVRLMRLPW